jgi:hypothetical protein
LDGLSTRKDKIRTIKEFFVDEKGRPTFNNDFFNMNMIPSNRQKVISDLAQALGTTRGINSSR